MIRRILHAQDGSEGAFKAFDFAVELARMHGAALEMISVEEIPHFAGTVGEVIEEQDAANHRFADAIARSQQIAASAGIELKAHVMVGHEVKTIVEFIKQKEFDLLVVGFMGHSALYDRVMGSTCQSLVRLAPCSVLVVK